MRCSLLVATAVGLALVATSAAAAPARRPAPDSAILVTGQRLKADGKPIAMSDWRVAETEHVLLYARGDEKEIAATAARLERLHFLLSILLNRVDTPDEAIKLRVYRYGDAADFDALKLGHARWQQGPYPHAFPTETYYDPREDGPVLATAATSEQIMLQQGRALDSLSQITPPDPSTPGLTGRSFAGPSGAPTGGVKVGEIAVAQGPDARLYAGFARNFLLTYFPAAYPRWYVEGFGEIFATMSFDGDAAIEYGRAPEGYRQVVETYGAYSLKSLLDGRYLSEKRSQTGWTPYHAWALAHLLFFSEEWKGPLHAYLAAIASGADPAAAGAALGDTAKLQREWSAYHGARVPFERLTYPAGRFAEPYLRRLTQDEGEYVKGRLVLGARVEIAGVDEAERAGALQRRGAWLAEIRTDGARRPASVGAQLLAAEGSCRSGDFAPCGAAADTALRLAPANPLALEWKGEALLGQALAAPAGTGEADLKAARSAIVRANRADTESPLPLLAYYRSYAGAQQPAPEAALLGLVKANTAAPAAPAVRLPLGEALIPRDAAAARRILLPVAAGAYESPEKPAAQAALDKIGR